ncbi:MAG: hypothetical protein AAGF26_02785 [Cyanobacteria bacterium P01_G01_bin.49]
MVTRPSFGEKIKIYGKNIDKSDFYYLKHEKLQNYLDCPPRRDR